MTLYRRYRPQKFSEIFGQNYIKTIIQNEVLSGQIAHAYLFCGPRGVGKTTMARLLAKAINCQERTADSFEPCNHCASCENINNNRHLEVVEIDAASNTGVDNVRENVISSSRVASSGKYKVFIIDEVHMLSLSAFNALLKTLEEPPARTVFILCTTEIQKVPATIVSRCQRFDFKRLSASELVKKLEYIADQENLKIDAEVLAAIARQANGYLRDAESLLGQIMAISDGPIDKATAELVMPASDLNEIINFLDYLSKKDGAKAIRLINGIIDNGGQLKNFLSDLIEILRKILLNKLQPGLADSLGLDWGENWEIKINELGQAFNLEQLVALVNRFQQAAQETKASFLLQLPVEVAIIELTSAPAKITPPTIKFTPPVVRPTAPKITNDTPPIVDNQSSGPALNLSLEEVSAKWSEVLVRIKPLNHSLSFILQACQIKSIQGSELNLVFKYKFHRDRLLEEKNKKIVEDALSQVYHGTLSINVGVDENLVLANPAPVIKKSDPEIIPVAEVPENPAGNMLGDILKTLGGEIIN